MWFGMVMDGASVERATAASPALSRRRLRRSSADATSPGTNAPNFASKGPTASSVRPARTATIPTRRKAKIGPLRLERPFLYGGVNAQTAHFETAAAPETARSDAEHENAVSAWQDKVGEGALAVRLRPPTVGMGARSLVKIGDSDGKDHRLRQIAKDAGRRISGIRGTRRQDRGSQLRSE